MYYSKEQDNCRLINAYNRPKTNAWLQKMKSFENIVEWWGVIGIFTDADYHVYDLEYNDERVLEISLIDVEYTKLWNEDYYIHMKECIEIYILKNF